MPAYIQLLSWFPVHAKRKTGDFADELPLSRSTVNQHLMELKDAGLVIGTIDGAKTYYCLNFTSQNISRLF